MATVLLLLWTKKNGWFTLSKDMICAIVRECAPGREILGHFSD